VSFNNDVRSDFESRTDSTVVTTNSIVVTASLFTWIVKNLISTILNDDFLLIVEAGVVLQTVLYDLFSRLAGTFMFTFALGTRLHYRDDRPCCS
jgi:hypothetical protein